MPCWPKRRKRVPNDGGVTRRGHGVASASPNRPSGFTLIELLVVMALIGLILTLVPGFLVRRQPGLDLEVAARAVADGLRQTRSEAVFGNREQVFAIDIEAKQFLGGGQRAANQLDRAIELSLYTAGDELIGDTTGRIRFFPDGSSTGGRIGLRLAEQQTEVRIDWLTGEVAIHDAP
jgi:general secretion pathway protein H